MKNQFKKTDKVFYKYLEANPDIEDQLIYAYRLGVLTGIDNLSQEMDKQTKKIKEQE